MAEGRRVAARLIRLAVVYVVVGVVPLAWYLSQVAAPVPTS